MCWGELVYDQANPKRARIERGLIVREARVFKASSTIDGVDFAELRPPLLSYHEIAVDQLNKEHEIE